MLLVDILLNHKDWALLRPGSTQERYDTIRSRLNARTSGSNAAGQSDVIDVEFEELDAVDGVSAGTAVFGRKMRKADGADGAAMPFTFGSHAEKQRAPIDVQQTDAGRAFFKEQNLNVDTAPPPASRMTFYAIATGLVAFTFWWSGGYTLMQPTSRDNAIVSVQVPMTLPQAPDKIGDGIDPRTTAAIPREGHQGMSNRGVSMPYADQAPSNNGLDHLSSPSIVVLGSD